MQRKLAWLDALFSATLLDQSFGEFGAFPHGHHPASDIAAKNTQSYLNSVTLVGFIGSDPEQRQAKGNGSKFLSASQNAGS
jgi:hypothetical protein